MIFDKFWHSTPKKELDKFPQKEKEISSVDKNNQVDENEIEEEYTFESTAKAIEDNTGRNLVLGSLMALGLMSAPIVYTGIEEASDDYPIGASTTYVEENEENKAILEKADSLSKEGRYSNVLEFDEFYRMLDYSALDGLPRTTRENIKICSRVSFLPINMHKSDAKRKIIEEYKKAQWSINHLAEEAKNHPMKSYYEEAFEYAMNNVTDREILEQVDFSELAYYQKDISFVKGLINFSREKIRRDDAQAAEKEQKAVESAQKLVDKIVDGYKTRANVSGNYDGDYVLSKGELASLLNFKSIEGLPSELQFKIIAKALANYKPEDLTHVKNKDNVTKENERVEAKRKQAQEILDNWGYKAQKEFFRVLHPNEIMVVKRD